MPNRTRYGSTYIACLLNSDEWEKKADHLIQAASLFQDSIQATWKSWSEGRIPPASDHFISIYFMLMSFAIENLFKAVIVRRDCVKLESEFRYNGKLPGDLKSHDLFALAESCGFKGIKQAESDGFNNMMMDAGDEELLKKLSRSAVWYGRYPVPIRPKEFQAILQAESESEPICLTSYHGDDDESIRSWVDRLKTILRNGT